MEYILIDIQQQPSRLNGVTMWRLTFYCLDDGTVHEMTVDNSYVNFKRSGWDHVVTDPCPWGVYRDLKRTKRQTRRGVAVVSADSRAKCIQELDDQAMALKLVELDQDQRRGGNQFQDLFST
jgi:hypothetical protein